MVFTADNRWQRLEQLFYAALDQAPAARRAFLDEACRGDAQLRQELESLLQSSEKTLGFLQKPVVEAALQVRASAVEGKRIGDYKVIRLIGEGGMGTVYLASRADELYQQEVAVKLMHAGAVHSRRSLLRFSAERQILANLNHPNIARLLDGGVTDEGLPFLVMEYVNGIRIDEYCRQRVLTTEERLRLFCAACEAVDYAHKHLVIHRDIKPANILVTENGVPKLLDFGIAKLLDPELGELGLTGTTDRMMTPDYASPEQVRGDAITTATDVYALGVVLYELLAGRKPFKLETTSPIEVMKTICEQMPPPPSVTSAENAALAAPDAPRRLKGDLDNIVLMAMRKEPTRRYASVSELAGDVQAYLTGYPVHARTENWSYRSGKFIGRHKAAVAAAGVVALALIGFSIGMGLLAKRETRERRLAERQSEFLNSIFQAATPDQARGQQVTARQLLDQGAQRIDRELADEPQLQAAMLDNVGRAYTALGLYSQAEPLLQRAYDLRRKNLGEENLDSAASLDGLATAIRLENQFQRAEPLFRRALSIREKKLGENNLLVAESLANLGECLYLLQRDSEAETLLRKALGIQRRLNKDSGEATRNYLALTLERRGDN
jgi:eukaryotic-like serine/threonine-protein kinase